ncbi:MAG: HINT domain-containing protein, partial [Gorillibacterium sp.]|nr:HINT domain-containing protein [Gorillibacterium sp.]
IQTDEGEKNIEDIEVGDMVLSKAEETGEVAYKVVTATFNHETEEIYKIQVSDQVIESTYNHPFWVDGKGWTFVKDLKVGDLLVQSDGHTLRIESIELLHKQVTVYNMTVDEFHTYFVSDLGIWVHNTNCGYKDITVGKSVRNVETNVMRADFEKSLVGDGWTKTVTKDGSATIYSKDGAKYVVRDKSNQGQPTADYYANGSKEATTKIRLGSDK